MVELIFSLAIIALATNVIVQSGLFLTETVHEIRQDALLYAQAGNILQQMQDKLENSEELHEEDYNDTGVGSGFRTSVEIRDIGTAFDKSVYFVTIHMSARGMDTEIETNGILRKGCSVVAETE